MKKFHFLIGALILSIQQLCAASTQPHIQEGRRLLIEEMSLLNKNSIYVIAWGGAWNDKINSLQVIAGLHSLDDFDLDYSRKWFMLCLISFMENVNRDEKARPYLKNYPFTAENFEFGLVLENFDTPSDPGNEKIACVFNNGNTIVYCYRERSTGRLKVFYRETFEDAEKKLQAFLKKEEHGKNVLEHLCK